MCLIDDLTLGWVTAAVGKFQSDGGGGASAQGDEDYCFNTQRREELTREHYEDWNSSQHEHGLTQDAARLGLPFSLAAAVEEQQQEQQDEQEQQEQQDDGTADDRLMMLMTHDSQRPRLRRRGRVGG